MHTKIRGQGSYAHKFPDPPPTPGGGVWVKLSELLNRWILLGLGGFGALPMEKYVFVGLCFALLWF